VGAVVNFNKHKFVLIDADEYAFRYMEEHPLEVRSVVGERYFNKLTFKSVLTVICVMRPHCSCPSAAHFLVKQSVLNGHLSYTATNFWSHGWFDCNLGICKVPTSWVTLDAKRRLVLPG
jgi:hypothetical protein